MKLINLIISKELDNFLFNNNFNYFILIDYFLLLIHPDILLKSNYCDIYI